MGWPTPNDYDEAAENLRHSMSDEELRGGQAALDDQQLSMVWAGSFASVYRINCPATGKSWALKCFTREVAARQERYRQIATHLEAARLPFTVPFVYLERGVQIRGQWFPAVKMEWVEGQTLNRFVEESLEKPKMLPQLLDLWPKLAARLRDAGIAHADLQHGNVLLVPAADGKLALKLIDYDGMYVPALAGTQSGEMGHPNYQHPWRVRQRAYNADVDRFSHLAIYATVHSLIGGKRDIWKRFNNEENLLFREQDYQHPEQSELLRLLLETNDPSVRGLVGRLVLACKQPLEQVWWLDELVVNGRVRVLTRNEESQVAEVLTVGKAAAALVPPLPLGDGLREGGAAVSIAGPLSHPLEVPEPATTDTRPATAEGTLPDVVETPTPLLVDDENRAEASPSVRARIMFLVRRFDALLARLAGDGNTILHGFLRVIVVGALCSGLISAGGLLYKQGREWAVAAQEAKKEAAAQAKAKKEAARKKAEAEAAGQQAKAKAETQKKAEAEAAGQAKANQEAAAQAKAKEEAARKKAEKEIAVDLGNRVTLEMVLIPAGEFLMGSTDADSNAGSDEKPQHPVRITNPFYLGKHLVTQEQWEAVMGDNPSNFKNPKNPVETVSWEDCQQFLDKLNAKPGLGDGKFQLPTEAQWEYACRAGSTSKYCYGDDELTLGEYAWYSVNSGSKTHTVGDRKPNRWGLYDMHGNVWEWCQDWYDSGYYAKSPTNDPTGSAGGSDRVNRGGGWYGVARICRSADRGSNAPGSRSEGLGLRVSRVAADTAAGAIPSAALRLRHIEAQTVEAGEPLSLTAVVENSDAWQGKVRFSLGPQSPPDATIDPQSGQLSWTPPPNQPAGHQDISVFATSPDGQTTKTSFLVNVTRATPAPVALSGKETAVDLGNGIKLELVLIPAGEFLMGTRGNSGDERRHQVQITKPFYLGKHLVTQEQWEAVMGDNPSNFKGPKNPVERVSWGDCQQFLDKLNAKPSLVGGKFQLPTEAQWEYACRAGSTTKYCFGDDESTLGDYAWYCENSGSKTHPVGEKKKNAWGLYDMHGNVYEWCQDRYGSGYYAKSPTDDPTGPATGSDRVRRGGAWRDGARDCRSALRHRDGPGSRYFDLGLRVSFVPADK